MNSTVKTVAFWLVIGLSALLLWQVIQAGRSGQKDKEVNFSQFLADVEQGNVHEVTVDGQQLHGKYRDGSAFHAVAPPVYPDMFKTLKDKGVVITVKDANSGSWPLQLLGTWAPLILLGALWFVLFFVSLFSPPVLDDADGTHANAARQIALSGDWVTLRVNNVRYLEKAPLPYWIVAARLRIFGCNTFAAHLPQALAVLLLTLLRLAELPRVAAITGPRRDRRQREKARTE